MDYKTALKNLAQRLILARIENNLTIEELAKKSGLTVCKIKKIESGNYNFEMKDFDKIGSILGIDIGLKAKNNPQNFSTGCF